MTNAPERELESLLRGEIAAAETYKQALAKVDAAEAGPLREIQRQHGEAIKFFYEQLTANGCEAPTHSGIWGFFARTVEGGASLLGDRMALSALRTGEQQGLEQYVKALQTGVLPANCRTYIESGLIPEQRRHIDVLTQLMAHL